MTKGDYIRLVKPMGFFDNIGEVCEVLNITEEGVITFKFGGLHMGCMSYDEFSKYFELVSKEELKPKKPKYVWTEWKPMYLNLLKDDGFKTQTIEVYVRNNGKKVQIKHLLTDGFVATGWASCSDEDEFDIDRGINIAIMRFKANLDIAKAKINRAKIEDKIKKIY